MESKVCTKCTKEKPLDQFSWKNRKVGRRASECKECHRVMRNKYYKGKTDKEKLQILGRKKEIKEWLNNLKSELTCNRCPENHISTLQFHHKDPGKKEISIANVVRNGWRKERILEEIRKCEVLCANCHAKEHYDKS